MKDNYMNRNNYMNRRNAIKLMLGGGVVAASSGCYIAGINKPGIRIKEPNPLFTTSFTTNPGEENLYVLEDIARIVAKKGEYDNGRLFIAARDYDKTCKELGLDASTEPPVLPGTRLNVRTGERERDYIPDTAGCIHLGGKDVVKVIGRKIEDVREGILKFHPDAEVNFISREGDIPVNYGQVYYFNFRTGKGGQEPLYGRRLRQLGAKFMEMMAGDYFFVFRDNDSVEDKIKYFTLIAEAGELISDSTQNIKLAHNDLVVGGKPDTLIENLEELIHKSAACWRDIKAFR